MVTSLKRFQACTARVSALNPQQITTEPRLSQRLRDTYRQVFCGVTVIFSWVLVHNFLLCPPRVYFPVLCKFWQLSSMANSYLLQDGLCHTQVCCTQSPCPCSRPPPTCISIGDAQTQSVSVSVGSLGPGAHKVYLSSLSISGGNGA